MTIRLLEMREKELNTYREVSRLKAFVSVDLFSFTPRLVRTVSATQQLYSLPISSIINFLTVPRFDDREDDLES